MLKANTGGMQTRAKAAKGANPAYPSLADLPGSCVEEIGPRLTTLTAQTSDTSTTLDVLLAAASDVVGAEAGSVR